MISCFHLIQSPYLRPDLWWQLRRRLVRPRGGSSPLLYGRLGPLIVILLGSTSIRSGSRFGLGSSRASRTLFITNGKIRLEFLRIRPSNRGCGVSSGSSRSSAGGTVAARGTTGRVGARQGFLGRFLAGLFLCDPRVDHVAKAL